MSSILDLVDRHAGRTLMLAGDATYTSTDVAERSARLAAWLRDAAHVQLDDRVVIELKNGVDAAAALCAVARVGAIAVAASPAWTPAQIEHVLRDSGAVAMLTSETRAAQLASSPARPPHVLAHATPEWEGLSHAWDHRAAVTEDAPAILIYTSGSTGAPKGVIHTHRNLMDFGRIVAGYLDARGGDRILWMLAWTFGYGLSQLLVSLYSGGALILPPSVMPADVVKAHDRHGATAIAQVPFGWSQLIDYLDAQGRTLEGLRYITNAGDGPSPALLDRLPRAFPGARIHLMYGQTECFRTTVLPPEQYDTKRGAMGYPIPEVQATVLESGELVHAGALVARGYWNAPEATARKFVDGALHTGDLVRQDEDGCLWFVGRSEVIIKTSGFRVSPVEIEEAARAHPSVHDACAFGVDDAALGQAVELAVVTSAPLELDDLMRHLRPRMPRYMLPRRVHFVPELPRSANGKLQRAAVVRAVTG